MAGSPRGLPRASSPILEAVCNRCVAELGVAHATVALASSDGLWTPAYATSEVAADLESQAFTVGEGPWYDTLREHAPVLVADLDGHAEFARWPLWAPAAHAAGVHSIAAFPIQAGAIAAGVLALLSEERGSLHGLRLTLALRLADIALLGLLDVLAGIDAATDRSAKISTRQADIDGAGRQELADVVRAEVHQAAGMIMVQAGIPIEHALARLRARAFETGRPITDVAEDVLARRMRFAPDQERAE